MGKYKRTEQEYREAVAASESLAGTCRFLGLIPVGGNYNTLKKKIAQFQIDTSHFTGQGWKKGKFELHPVNRPAIRGKLIRTRGHRCQSCKLSEWLGQPIMLELEHVDGDNTNQEDGNLLLLCPNCHAQTPTWRSQNNKLNLCDCGREKFARRLRCESCQQNRAAELRAVRDRRRAVLRKANHKVVLSEEPKLDLVHCACGNPKRKNSKDCMVCHRKTREKIDWPPSAELRTQVAARSYLAVAKGLGVSDVALRKRLINHP